MISSVGSPSPTFSFVNGFFVVGVVIVFLHFHLFVRLLLYQVLDGSNSRFVSYGISFVSVIGSPSTGPYFVTSSTGGVTTSPVFGFLIPGLPGTSSCYLSVRLDRIHLCDLVVLLRHHNVRFHPLDLL